MKILGITRRIDELGRIVIPKEIRKKMNIKLGDLFEVYINDENSIILKKYSLINENKKMIYDYIKLLSLKTKSKIIITDLNKVILSSDNKNINEKLICDIERVYKSQNNIELLELTENYKIKKPYIIDQINPNGDLIGYFICDSVTQENKDLLLFSKMFINKYFEN